MGGRLLDDGPAGSFRCDRFVKSSLASSIAGFIRGGKEEVESSWSVARVVSTVFVWLPDLVSLLTLYPLDGRSYLAILQCKDERDFLAVDFLIDYFGGHPTLDSIRLPRLGADVVIVSHDGGGSECKM